MSISALTSITVPCTLRDDGAFARLLACWSDSRFFPVRPREDFAPIRLAVVVNRLEEDVEARFKGIFLQRSEIHCIFKECVILDAGLEGEKDIYVRGESQAKGRYGNKAGPNFLFFETMRLVQRFGGFTFQCEVDCYPLRSGWLTDLNRLVSERAFAWVIGSIYTGQRPVGRDIQMHFNGNAVYQSGNPDFIAFVDNVWQPRVIDYVDLDPNLAYDCWWALETSRASALVQNSSWGLVSAYSQYFCNNQFLINLVDGETAAEDAEKALGEERVAKHRCLFLHGHPATPLVAEFLAGPQTDFPRFLSTAAEERRRARADVPLDLGADFSSIALETEEVSLWGAFAGAANITAAPPTINLPISVETLPASLLPGEIAPGSYLGAWYKETISDHIWAGASISSLSFRFKTPQRRVQIALRGKLGPEVLQQMVQFRAFGAARVALSSFIESLVTFTLEDDKPFQSVVVMVDVQKAGKVEGDMRDLGFVLFGIEIT